MSTEKKKLFTPGIWLFTSVPIELRSTDSAAAIYGPIDRNGGACLIADISRSPGDVEADANSILMASATDLYFALKEVSPLIDGLINRTPTGKKRDELCDLNIKVKSALLKATGHK